MHFYNVFMMFQHFSKQFIGLSYGGFYFLYSKISYTITFITLFTIFIIVTTMMSNIKNVNKNEIVKTWISGQKSVTLIVERKSAEEYDLMDPQYVVLERKPEGILIRKLEMAKHDTPLNNRPENQTH